MEDALQSPETKFWESPIGKSLDTLIDQDCLGDVRDEYSVLLSKLRRNHYYWHGKQNLVRSRALGLEWMPAEDMYRHYTGYDPQVHDYNLNHFKADGVKFISVVAARVPQMNAVPENPDDPDASARCPGANALLRYLLVRNRADLLVKQVARIIWQSGTAFVKTRYRADKEAYGVRQMNPMETELRSIPTPDGMDLDWYEAPVASEGIEIPRGMAELEVYDGFSVVCPFDSSSEQMKDVPWLVQHGSVHKAVLFQAYPELREPFLADDRETKTDSASHDAAESGRIRQSPDRRNPFERRNRLWVEYIWLTPGMYFLVNDDEAMQDLQAECPEGCMVMRVNGKVVSKEPERLQDVWRVIRPYTDTSIYSDAIGDDYIPALDFFHKILNRNERYIDSQMPKTLVNTDYLSLETLKRSNAEELIGMDLGGASWDQVAFRMPQASPDSGQFKLAEFVLERGRENAGLNPAMWGAGGGGRKTAREVELQNNQSLRQLNPLWDNIRFGLADAFLNLVLAHARNAADDEFRAGASSWDLQDLAKGGFRFEPEEAMPQTAGQLRDYLLNLTQNEFAANLTGLTSPSAASRVRELMGIQGIESSEAALNEAVHSVIRSLIDLPEEQLLPEVLEELAPVDPYIFEPMPTAMMIRDWFLSDTGRQIKQSRPRNWKAVVGWGRQMIALAQQQQVPPPEAPPQEAAPGGPGGEIPPLMMPEDIGVNEQANVSPDVQSLDAAMPVM